MKKVLVPVKRVPDYQMKVKINAAADGIVQEGVKWIVNPFDEIAVEEALRIRENHKEVEVVVASIGPESCTEQLRSALAMGADRAILVKTDAEVDSFVAAEVLSALCRRDSFALVIMGKQAIDSDASQTGPLLAASLEQPQATFASKVVIDSSWERASVTREVDGGLETISVSLPAILTTDLRLNEPRYPSLPGIVQAKKKPLDTVSLEELGVSAMARVQVKKMEYPPTRSAGTKVASVDELLQKLQSEAKVL